MGKVRFGYQEGLWFFDIFARQGVLFQGFVDSSKNVLSSYVDIEGDSVWDLDRKHRRDIAKGWGKEWLTFRAVAILIA